MRKPRTRLAVGLLIVLTAMASMSFAEDQNQALMKAAQKGDLNQVQELLGKGADVNAKTKTGWTALMAAAGAG